MLRSLSAVKLKSKISQKVHSKNYLKNFEEPKDKLSHDSLAKDEEVLVGDSSVMRHKFRGVAHRIRIIRTEKIKKQQG